MPFNINIISPRRKEGPTSTPLAPEKTPNLVLKPESKAIQDVVSVLFPIYNKADLLMDVLSHQKEIHDHQGGFHVLALRRIFRKTIKTNDNSEEVAMDYYRKSYADFLKGVKNLPIDTEAAKGALVVIEHLALGIGKTYTDAQGHIDTYKLLSSKTENKPQMNDGKEVLAYYLQGRNGDGKVSLETVTNFAQELGYANLDALKTDEALQGAEGIKKGLELLVKHGMALKQASDQKYRR